MVFIEQARSGLLWLFDVERRTYRVLSNGGIAASPVWSPDGKRLAVGWSEAGPVQLWILSADGGEWERITEGPLHHWAPSWSPDGRFLAYSEDSVTTHDLLLYSFEDRRTVPLVATNADERGPEFSPNGRWLAYASDESGRFEVYVTSFPDREQTLTVSREGGNAPAWSHDGSRLFYYSLPSPEGDRSMMVVPVQEGPALRLGQPEVLFRLPDGHVALSPMRSYEVHPDGRHFVIGRRVETEPEPPITRFNLVHNWHEELNRLAPVN
jgi:Tol biopolymer transport system component